MRPAFYWCAEQQEPSKIASFQMQLADAEQERAVRCFKRGWATRQQVTLYAPCDGLEHIRLQLLQNGIKLPFFLVTSASETLSVAGH